MFPVADEIKRITVHIGGMSYQLVSAENENYTRQIAAKADEMIRRVMQNNPQLSLNMSSILALVNALDELSRVYQQINTIDSQRHDNEKQAAEARKELMRLREQNWEMKKEILRLNALCKDFEALLEKAAAAASTASAGTADLPEKAELPGKAGENAGEIDFEEDSTCCGEIPAAEMPVQKTDTNCDLPGASQAEPARSIPGYGEYLVSRLTQTNLEDYLRENGWPQPVEQKSYDRKSK